MTQKVELPAQLQYYIGRMLDEAGHPNERLNYFFIVEKIRDDLDAALTQYQRSTMQDFGKNKKRNK